MPIGVPRIIYCWGEELPAQWTDIYNFIFRRRMVFLMQYLDDELCNQICGLLINIHMEDRSKELEKKEMERSGVFKGSTKTTNAMSRSDERKGVDALSQREGTNASFYNKKSRSMEDLLNADEDLGIDDIDTLEQYTLQKITTEWLNWNAQFFDYSDEPYLFYLAELLSKDFSSSFPPGQQERGSKSQNNVSTYSSFPYGINQTDGQTEDPNKTEISAVGELLNMLKNTDSLSAPQKGSGLQKGLRRQMSVGRGGINKANMQMGEVYSPFRTNTNFSLFQKEAFNNLSSSSIGVPKEGKKQKLLEMFQNYQNFSAGRFNNSFDYTRRGKEAVSPFTGMNVKGGKQRTNSLYKSSLHKGGASTGLNQTIYNLLSNLAHKDLDLSSSLIQEKVLGQKNLRRSFALENQLSSITSDWDQMNSFNAMSDRYEEGGQKIKSFNYLNSGNISPGSNAMSEFRDYYRKQTERALIEEESKKVFVIINSFGGSVGNGVTVHDALQFIKAGSLTLALGVAASAASLVLAGGTIGERYVTEGCHVMMHQPEGGLQGQASDIWIDSQEIMKIRLDVAEIYSLSTYRPRHKILRDLDRDFYLTATETIQYGLADEIATNDTMKEIINMTSQVWDYHDSKQQRLLESRESASSGLDTQTQN